LVKSYRGKYTADGAKKCDQRKEFSWGRSGGWEHLAARQRSGRRGKSPFQKNSSRVTKQEHDKYRETEIIGGKEFLDLPKRLASAAQPGMGQMRGNNM